MVAQLVELLTQSGGCEFDPQSEGPQLLCETLTDKQVSKNYKTIT